MPVIPVVGRKALRIRLLVGSLYLLLTLGAVVMVYPFALMVSTATTGNADWREFKLVPRYWFSRAEQFRKYVTDKARTEVIAYEYGHEEWFGPFDIKAGHFDPIMSKPPEALRCIVEDYRQFVAGIDGGLKHLYFVDFPDLQHSVLSQRPVYFEWVKQKHGGDLARVNRLYEDTAQEWAELGMPRSFSGAWETEPLTPRHADWREFVLSRSYAKQKLISLDQLAFVALRRRYGSLDMINASYGTSFNRLYDIRWDTLGRYEWGREVQELVLRKNIPLEHIRLKPEAQSAFEEFVRESKTDGPVQFTLSAPAKKDARSVWIRFVRSERCQLDYFDPVDPQRLWQAFLRRRYTSLDAIMEAHNGVYGSFDDIRLPARFVDYAAFSRNRSSILRKFLFGNLAMVVDYVLIHGRALINTLILIALTIFTTLTVNPMAAYALSRFRLKYAHHILVFLLATMAFPTEVAMIPNFLLIKSFPLGALILGVSAFVMFFLVQGLLKRRISLFWRVLIGTSIAISVAWFLPPRIAALMGRQDLNVSLMNTFFALVLPGIANGYSIFLLKGFFDSLPPELYEAGMLDGASETRMFFSITLPLCKPVLAVIALGAFTTAYGAFMFAFLTCQDPSMWTLMVFLYQFQQMYSVPLVMASLVIAAIPTLLVFILCQGIILRGIVIPTFK